MRSLLFVPADSAKKLDKAMTSGADALDRRSRGFDRARRQSARPRQRGGVSERCDCRGIAALYPGARERAADRPDRCRSRRRRAGKARRHHAAEGRRRRVGRARRRQARRARSDRRPGRRPRQDSRARHRNRGVAVPHRHLCRLERAAQRPDLGRRGSVRRTRRAGEPRRAGPLSRSLSAGAGALPRRRHRRQCAGARHRLRRFPQQRRF